MSSLDSRHREAHTDPMTTRHEVAVDIEIAACYRAVAAASRAMTSAEDSIRRAAGQRRDYRSGAWSGDWPSALGAAPAHLDAAHSKATNALGAAEGRLEAAETAYEGWSRFFLVTSSNGHIHKDMRCTTCYQDTEYAWLPELSDLDEAAAVEAYGEILCSVCFPSAPAAWTKGESKTTIADREARFVKKAAADQAKAAKAIRADGEPLRLVSPTNDRYSNETIHTISAAKSRLTDLMEYRYDDNRWMVQPLAEALADRLDSTPEAEIEAATKRAAKRG